MKYFTKYLPVEGEIKEGDRVRIDWENGDVTYDTVSGIRESLPIRYGLTKDHWCYKELATKVKLFLCSRDIQVGDNWNDGEYDAYLMRKSFAEKQNFKVIGEVSPEATWVKEGMKFDEEEVKTGFWTWDTEFGTKSIECSIKQPYGRPYARACVLIKGPCGHFH